MRTTGIRFTTHLGMQFKVHWLIKRKRRIAVRTGESILAAKGIEVFDPKTLLRPALREEPYNPEVPVQEVTVEKTPCYMISNAFQPLQFLSQAQLITNSLAFETLPECCLAKVKLPSKEDEKVLRDAVIHAHLLDAQQAKLPYNTNYEKYPGYKPLKPYGIKSFRKVKNLMYPLLLQLNQEQPHQNKNILENILSRVTLNHADRMVHMNHSAWQLVCSKSPMEPVLGPKEVNAHRGAPMPDIYPFSPFVHCRLSTKYDDLIEGFGVPGARLAPHTVIVDFTRLNMEREPLKFYAMSLIHAFSHAASYAKELKKDLAGDLDKPVTVNVFHTNGQYIQVGRFQLNTLDLTGPTRNFYWYAPWEKLFEEVGFRSAKPFVEGLNANPLTLMRALF